jgi:nucleoside-diphosphate-sugar epimerase
MGGDAPWIKEPVMRVLWREPRERSAGGWCRHRDRDFALVGDGGGVWSFIPTADAAEATVAAVTHGGQGVYNIVDDDPAPVAEWLPALARTLGAKQPTRAPRLAAGEAGAVLMPPLGGAANAKATRALGWQPRHPSWRQGLAT